MTRRREGRRRHRAERRDREPSAPPAAPAPEPTAAEPWYREISWTGLLGGVIGFIAIAQAAVVIVVTDQDDIAEAWAIPVLGAAAVYLPAVWVSLRPHPRRRSVIRVVLAVTLVLMVIGAVLIDVGFFGLLLIPSALLAHAAGLIYQRREPRT